MGDVINGCMAIMSTRTTATVEPMGCSTIYIGSTHISIWFTNRGQSHHPSRYLEIILVGHSNQPQALYGRQNAANRQARDT